MTGNKDREIQLESTHLRGAILKRVMLVEADLEWVNMANTEWREVHLHDSKLREANLSYSRIHDCNLSRMELSECLMIGTVIEKANLSGLDCRGIDVRAVLIEAGAKVREETGSNG